MEFPWMFEILLLLIRRTPILLWMIVLGQTLMGDRTTTALSRAFRFYHVPPPPTGNSVGTNEATMLPTPKNAPSWRVSQFAEGYGPVPKHCQRDRMRSTCVWGPLLQSTHRADRGLFLLVTQEPPAGGPNACAHFAPLQTGLETASPDELISLGFTLPLANQAVAKAKNNPLAYLLDLVHVCPCICDCNAGSQNPPAQPQRSQPSATRDSKTGPKIVPHH